MTFEVIIKGEQVALATETGDDGTLTDDTACLSDGSINTSCVEVKIAQAIRAEWDHVPGAMTLVTLKIGVESTMNDGTLRIAPYLDFNSIDNGNGKTTVSIVDASTPYSVDESLAQALVDDCLTSKFTFRLFENGSGAKIKVSELSIEATIATISLAGVTKDDEDVIDDLLPLVLWRRTGGSAPYDWVQIDKQTSLVTTGAYDFNYEDDGSQYRVMAQNTDGTESDITPEVQGV